MGGINCPPPDRNDAINTKEYVVTLAEYSKHLFEGHMAFYAANGRIEEAILTDSSKIAHAVNLLSEARIHYCDARLKLMSIAAIYQHVSDFSAINFAKQIDHLVDASNMLETVGFELDASSKYEDCVELQKSLWSSGLTSMMIDVAKLVNKMTSWQSKFAIQESSLISA